jgi:hypothetical protein
MNAKEVYMHVADVCERAAATALLPETKVGMLASAAMWRRLAANFRPWAQAKPNPPQDKLAEQAPSLEESDARSYSRDAN